MDLLIKMILLPVGIFTFAFNLVCQPGANTANKTT